MRSSLLNFFAFLIVLTSISFPSSAVKVPSGDVNTIQSINAWDNDPLTTFSPKFSETFSVIAQDFIPIVLISDHSQPSPRFDHYLPIYQLERAKEYFLLI